jgi:hypothetical protein
LALAQQ